MQLSFNSTGKYDSLSLKKPAAKLSSISFAIILSAAGMIATGNTYAAGQSTQATQKVAANDNVLAGKHYKHHAKSHKASASTDNKSDDNHQLGGYSLQDGAMQGLYGDGEYAE